MVTLITGGAGFIGSQLALALLRRDERLILLDNFNDYYDPRLKRANIAAFNSHPEIVVIEGDVRDAALVDKVIGQYQVQRIAHLAAMAGVRNSAEQAPLYFEVNVQGSVNLFEAARKHGVRQFVLASTSSVYGETKRLPFVEDDAADRPLAPYPASKRATELLAYSYYHLFGLNVNCLRFFNVYGPNGRPDMMPLQVIHALCEDKPITLFDGGRLQRDWTYIDDIVEGIVAALERQFGYEIINLGCGEPHSMTEFVDILEKLTGKQAHRIVVPAPLTEPPITYCNNSRARKLLDFQPQTSLVEGLAKTWAWYERSPTLLSR